MKINRNSFAVVAAIIFVPSIFVALLAYGVAADINHALDPDNWISHDVDVPIARPKGLEVGETVSCVTNPVRSQELTSQQRVGYAFRELNCAPNDFLAY